MAVAKRLRWLALLLPVLASACGPPPFPQQQQETQGGYVNFHMGGSYTSFGGTSSGSR